MSSEVLSYHDLLSKYEGRDLRGGLPEEKGWRWGYRCADLDDLVLSLSRGTLTQALMTTQPRLVWARAVDTQVVELEIAIPDGFEYVDTRQPMLGEWVCSVTHSINSIKYGVSPEAFRCGSSLPCHIILKQKD